MKQNLILIFVLALAVGVLLAGCLRQGGGSPTEHSGGSGGASVGETKTEANTLKTAVLQFDSFDGGGPSFSAILEDSGVVSVEKAVKYAKKDHELLDGASFTVSFTFTGRKPGTTGLTIEERSPIAGNYDRSYTVTVAEDLSVSIEALAVTNLDEPMVAEPIPTLVIAVGNRAFYASMEDNSSATEFAERLSREPIAVELHDYGGFEKVGELPWELPRNEETISTEPGDIILYQGNQLSIYYDENSWELTPLARINSVTKEELLAALGDGDVKVTLWIEWSE